jgi:NodT family efflux transporter outer membrane factor (OMF) lipoprotein
MTKTAGVYRSALALALATALAGCAAVGPEYALPETPTSAAWKSAPAAAGWLPAAPADALDRGEWWKLFNDPTLDELAARVQVSNQNIAAAVASYAQAQALVRGQRAALLPSLTASASDRRSGPINGDSSSEALAASLNASWAPDLWGRLRRSVESAQASVQASEADLASARLSVTGALASNYFSLREADAELRILDATLEGYERSLQIARNRYEAGLAAPSDVQQAETLLINTRADRVALQRTRDTLEHAIAVLTGAAPAGFSLPASPDWRPVVPGVPAGVPSTLLQRRPDIAAAERSVAAANAQIGVARSAYYPSLTLSGSVGSNASRLFDLFSAANTLWALGLSVAQTLFDGGAIDASVAAAQAGHEAAVARYRQTVLSAFQNVEDQLTAAASLAEQETLRRQASAAADRTEQQFLNRYRAGTVDYTSVVSVQASALSARRALLQVLVSRQTSAVALIQALGGGWQADWMAQRVD